MAETKAATGFGRTGRTSAVGQLVLPIVDGRSDSAPLRSKGLSVRPTAGNGFQPRSDKPVMLSDRAAHDVAPPKTSTCGFTVASQSAVIAPDAAGPLDSPAGMEL